MLFLLYKKLLSLRTSYFLYFVYIPMKMSGINTPKHGHIITLINLNHNFFVA